MLHGTHIYPSQKWVFGYSANTQIPARRRISKYPFLGGIFGYSANTQMSVPKMGISQAIGREGATLAPSRPIAWEMPFLGADIWIFSEYPNIPLKNGYFPSDRARRSHTSSFSAERLGNAHFWDGYLDIQRTPKHPPQKKVCSSRGIWIFAEYPLAPSGKGHFSSYRGRRTWGGSFSPDPLGSTLFRGGYLGIRRTSKYPEEATKRAISQAAGRVDFGK